MLQKHVVCSMFLGGYAEICHYMVDHAQGLK